MRVTVLASGSRGDVQPYLALSAGLRRAGHRVCIATHESYAAAAGRLGLEHTGIPTWFERFGADYPLFQSARSPTQLGRGVLMAPGFIRDWLRGQAPVFLEAARGSDLIVYSLTTFEGIDIAEKLQIPAVFSALCPISRTGEHPNLFFGLGDSRRSRTLNLWSHRLMATIYAAVSRPAWREWREQVLELPPAAARPSFGELPVLCAFSPHVVARPQDWPAGVELTGYWTLPEEGAYQPPVELARFLEGRPRPIYVGLGSVPIRDPGRFSRILLDALRAADLRAVVNIGLSRPVDPQLAGATRVLAVEDVPHAWLFPRVSAVVCHGGAGTVGAALRAGVPLVVVPHFCDQPFWGDRVHAIGAGPAPLRPAKLSPRTLLAALERALSPATVARAAAIGRDLRAEDGVGRAVALLDARLRAAPGEGATPPPPEWCA